MAADDDDRGPAPDPWDDIVAEGLGEEAGGISFRFEEESADVSPPSGASAEPIEPAAAGPEDPILAAGGEAAAGDDNGDAAIADWLSDGAKDAETPPLVVFDPEDAATGSSGIDIGTGGSGIALHGPAEQEEIGADDFTTAVGTGAEEAAGGWPVADENPAGEAAGVEGPGDGFPNVTAAVAPKAGAKPAKAVRRPARPAKKSGGIGQLIGVVMGGVMAIPITLAILIYGLGKDPFGVTKKVPAEAAFLLPEKFRPGYKKPRAAAKGVAGESSLDSLPKLTEPVEPVVEPDEPVVEPPDLAVPDPDMPPAIDVPVVEPEDPLDAPGSGLDALGVQPPPTAPAEPPPLDTAALDAAVIDAAALGEAIGAVDDTENEAYRKLRIRWYRALARVAEELVAVENEAATSGRPLAGAADGMAALHDGIGRRERLAAELASLAPDWLAYPKRGGDGIVVPVTFESARRVGPYWAVKASLTDADGRPRELTVIARHEPAAITGDRVVVTGVALDGAVIWAADIRGMAVGGRLPGF